MSEDQSEGHEFKSHSKQIFALTFKLLIDYMLGEPKEVSLCSSLSRNSSIFVAVTRGVGVKIVRLFSDRS